MLMKQITNFKKCLFTYIADYKPEPEPDPSIPEPDPEPGLPSPEPEPLPEPCLSKSARPDPDSMSSPDPVQSPDPESCAISEQNRNLKG